MAGRKRRVKEPVPTNHYFFTDECPTCAGKGRVKPARRMPGWYIDYHLQDGHETCGPYPRATALKMMDDSDGRTSMTLIGPDGRVYVYG